MVEILHMYSRFNKTKHVTPNQPNGSSDII